MKSKIHDTSDSELGKQYPKNIIYAMSNKITLVFAFIGMIMLEGCSTDNENVDNDTFDNDTISQVFEYSNINFVPNNYSVILTFPRPIFNSDMVLVYRLSGIFKGKMYGNYY
jgi:hypothetical protein